MGTWVKMFLISLMHTQLEDVANFIQWILYYKEFLISSMEIWVKGVFNFANGYVDFIKWFFFFQQKFLILLMDRQVKGVADFIEWILYYKEVSNFINGNVCEGCF